VKMLENIELLGTVLVFFNKNMEAKTPVDLGFNINQCKMNNVKVIGG